MKRQLTVAIYISLVAFVVSCSTFDYSVFNLNDKRKTKEYTDAHRTIVITEVPDMSDGITIGQKMPNPYSYEVMLEAWSEMHAITKEEPDTTEHIPEASHIYIRVLPESSEDVDWILESNYEFYNYPLDYEIIGDPDEYHDPTLPDSVFTWFYTVMPIDATLPTMEYEIIEVCYIPEDTETGNGNNGCFSQLEQVAFKISGYNRGDGGIDWEDPDDPGEDPGPGGPGGPGGNGTGTNNFIQGYIRYYDDTQCDLVGVKGLRVSIRNSMKIRTVYTDENGYYSTPNVFGTNALSRKVSFQNSYGFSCMHGFLLGPLLTPKTITVQDNWNINTSGEHKYWVLANINNAAYDWFSYCDTTGIQMPANDIRISALSMNIGNSGSTVMLKHGMSYFVVPSDVISLMAGIPLPSTIPNFLPLRLMIQLILPDIFIIEDDSTVSSKNINKTVTHELAHASHFQQLGSNYFARCWWWKDVFDYEVAQIILSDGNNPYGSEADNGSGPCGVTEMWAYAMGYFGCSDYYGYSSYPDTKDHWFKDSVLYSFFINNQITPKNAFDLLMPEVRNIHTFASELKQEYPELSNTIDLNYGN